MGRVVLLGTWLWVEFEQAYAYRCHLNREVELVPNAKLPCPPFLWQCWRIGLVQSSFLFLACMLMRCFLARWYQLSSRRLCTPWQAVSASCTEWKHLPFLTPHWHRPAGGVGEVAISQSLRCR